MYVRTLRLKSSCLNRGLIIGILRNRSGNQRAKFSLSLWLKFPKFLLFVLSENLRTTIFCWSYSETLQLSKRKIPFAKFPRRTERFCAVWRACRKIGSSKESIHSRDYYLPRRRGEEGDEWPEVSPPLKSEWSGPMGKHLSSTRRQDVGRKSRRRPPFLPSFLFRPISSFGHRSLYFIWRSNASSRGFSPLSPSSLREEGGGNSILSRFNQPGQSSNPRIPRLCNARRLPRLPLLVVVVEWVD